MITVFTATYNRAYILPQLYHSLQQQTDCNFEWLIIDDGSRDNTAALVQTWQRETSAFPVVYVKQPNGGKHRAINAGLAQARGEWYKKFLKRRRICQKIIRLPGFAVSRQTNPDVLWETVCS